jgi:hypothetical protein
MLRRLTFAGATLAVVSSSLLYGNFFFFAISSVGGKVRTCAWINPLVFGHNMDSIFNDAGLFLMQVGQGWQSPATASHQPGRKKLSGSRDWESSGLAPAVSIPSQSSDAHMSSMSSGSSSTSEAAIDTMKPTVQDAQHPDSAQSCPQDL